jgi:microcystin-dependent protein
MDNAFIGSIVLFAGNYAPKGWAFCHGQMLPINKNQALFAILGATNGISSTYCQSDFFTSNYQYHF